MTYFMAVTADKYELPIFVGTSVQVADYCGIKVSTLRQIAIKNSNPGKYGNRHPGTRKGLKIVRVNVTDE